jgi:UTP--glucose-1-phosphate uridylyltransferase
MLPVVNKPVIQWVVEEAVEAGITDIAIITGKHKQAIKNHFYSMDDLEEALQQSGKIKELETIKKINNMANLTFIIQNEQKGLGHAILCAEEFVGDSPFAVLLGDTICVGSPNCTEGLINIYKKRKSSVFSVEEIRPEETRRYGVVSGKRIEEGLILVDELIEKPEPEKAPSLLGIQGRYVFTPDLFDFQKKVPIGAGGEMQLTDAMQGLAKESNLYSWIFNGKRYDIGTMKDWFQSHLELSLKSDFSDVIIDVVSKL